MPSIIQIQEAARVAALAADREGDGSEGQGHAAADRLDPLLPG
jgi:hypothetical protein